MVLRINALPRDLANQIAAGEVIERPSSVVKELLENARDACATHIHIEVEYAGLNRICVADNGTGIHPEDLPLAVAAHATSKIKTLGDLYSINTMGFRGEALASIASVTRLTIQSKTDQFLQASQLSRLKETWRITPCARQRGTTVEACDLFYNAPVRKRFFKSERTEFLAIDGVVRRFALSTPEAAVVLVNNGKVVLELPAATDDKRLLVRLERLFGKNFIRSSKYIDAERAGMQLRGWISSVDYQRSQSDKLWIYVNQRIVKDKILSHALKQAYDSVIYPGKYPACLLYLKIDPSEVDVNVHPTKHELRFQQPRLVHDFIYSQIKKQLGTESLSKKQHLIADFSSPQSTMRSRWHISEPRDRSEATQTKNDLVANKMGLQLLSQDYGILKWREKWFLWHKSVLIEKALLWHVNQQSLPLLSRPLLVPLRCPLTTEQKKGLGLYLPLLLQVGIKATISNSNLQWQSIPVSFPQISLDTLVDKLFEQQPVDEQAIVALLIKEQLLQITSIDSITLDLLEAFFDTHQQEIEHSRVEGITQLTGNHCKDILYG